MSLCLWNGHPVDCASIFFLTPTDDGLCCVFNFDKTTLREEIPFQKFFDSRTKEGIIKDAFTTVQDLDLTPRAGRNKGFIYWMKQRIFYYKLHFISLITSNYSILLILFFFNPLNCIGLKIKFEVLKTRSIFIFSKISKQKSIFFKLKLHT